MERLIQRVAYVDNLLFVGLLASLGIVLSYTYGWFQPDKEGETLVRQHSDYPTEWLGI